MGDIRIEIDPKKLDSAIQNADGTPKALGTLVKQVASKANALASGYRTGYYYDRSIGKRKGGTQAKYAGNVKKKGKSQVGLVYTSNYSAQKENMEHNTLLKSL